MIASRAGSDQKEEDGTNERTDAATTLDTSECAQEEDDVEEELRAPIAICEGARDERTGGGREPAGRTSASEESIDTSRQSVGVSVAVAGG